MDRFAACFGRTNTNTNRGNYIELRERLGTINGLESPLFSSILTGNVDGLITWLELLNDPTSRDLLSLGNQDSRKSRTALHYAVTYCDEDKALEMANLLLNNMTAAEKQQIIDIQDHRGETALHLAARFRHSKVAKRLIDSGANTSIRTKKGVTVLESIFECIPSVMCQYLDRAITNRYTGDSNTLQEQRRKDGYDFSFREIIGTVGSVGESDDTATIFAAIKDPAREYKYKSLLRHPLTQVFIRTKWEKMRYIFGVSIGLHVLWSIMCACYLGYLYIIWCPKTDIAVASNETDVISGNHMNDTEVPEQGLASCNIEGSHLELFSYTIVILSISMFAKEFYELCTSANTYFNRSKLENIGQILLIIFMGVSCSPVVLQNARVIIIYTWQYQVAVFTMLLPWILILSQLGKTQTFGIIIEMFVRVCINFVKFSWSFGPILLAFTFSFMMLMPKHPSFQHLPLAFVQVLVMGIGEVDFGNLLSEITNGEEKIHLSSSVAGLIVIMTLFVIIVAVNLINLLIAQNMADIQGLTESAEINELASTLERIHYMEVFLIKCHKWLCIHSDSPFNIVKRISLRPSYGVPISKENLPVSIRNKVIQLALKNKFEAIGGEIRN